jgi:phenylpyruvate tautomerase PptA (4-oxalocrotonate tautomerase family)
MNARALFVRLLEDRREVRGTTDARKLRAKVAADIAAVLHDQLRRRRNRITVVVRDRRAVVADCRAGRVCAVALVVVRRELPWRLTSRPSGILIAREEIVVRDDFAAREIDVLPVESGCR